MSKIFPYIFFMKRITHFASGAALGAVLAPDMYSATCCLLGSLAPDWLDKAVSLGNWQRWEKIHRTWSHTLMWWGLFIGILSIVHVLPPLVFRCLFFFGTGALLHLALDSLNPMGIPIFPKTRRFSFNIVKTGSWGDYMIAAISVAIVATSQKDWLLWVKKSLRMIHG